MAKKGTVEWLTLYQGVEEETDERGKKTKKPKGNGVTINEDLAGVQVGLRFIGPRRVGRWQTQQVAIQNENARQLGEARKGYTRDQVPELYGEAAFSEEGLRQHQALCRDVFAEVVAGIRGGDDAASTLMPEDGRAYAAAPDDVDVDCPVMEWLEGLDFADQFRLRDRCMRAQSVNRRQLFRAPDSGDVGPAEPAAA